MDVMQLRSGLMMAQNNVQIKIGTFVGSDNIDQTISIGFEPDIVITNCRDLDIETAGWQGQKNIVIVKNMVTYQLRHNDVNQTTASTAATDNVGGVYPAYGITDGYYTAYGSYSNGNFTFSNGSRNSINRFVNGYTYDWIAIKYTN